MAAQPQRFRDRLKGGDPAATKEEWQRFYFKGEHPEHPQANPEAHLNKLRLPRPVDRRRPKT